MPIRLTFGLLLPLFLCGQATTPPKPAKPTSPAATPGNRPLPAQSPASPQSLAPSAPVVTVAGVCADAAIPPSRCSTTVTRKDFEALVGIVQPEMDSAQRQRLAVLYSQLLVFANAAQHQGLDKTPGGQEALRFAQLQALSQVLSRKLQAETSKVSADDVQKYYREHPKEFEEASLDRLYIPRNAQAAGKPVKEEDVQTEMAKLRVRAVQGESFGTLQKQAYADLGLMANPPATLLQKARRGGLSSSLASAFDLQLGVVSQPVSEADGLYLFRLISKRELSLQEANAEVIRTLQTQRLQQALQLLTASAKATFDTSYFGVAANTPPAASGPPPVTNLLPASANPVSVPAGSLPGAEPKQQPATAQAPPK